MPPHRVRALQAIFKSDEEETRTRGLPPIPTKDTSQYTEEKWNRLRERVAQLWYHEELEQQKHQRSSIDVLEGIAVVLEGYRHEVGFLNSVSDRVDELWQANTKD